jgi:hypothetical protein
MNKALLYVVGFIGVTAAAVVLYVLAQDVFDISQRSIAVGSPSHPLEYLAWDARSVRS